LEHGRHPAPVQTICLEDAGKAAWKRRKVVSHQRSAGSEKLKAEN
jgi:hypothetical protein